MASWEIASPPAGGSQWHVFYRIGQRTTIHFAEMKSFIVRCRVIPTNYGIAREERPKQSHSILQPLNS